MTITVDVDTYITLADARAYVTANGLTPLPTVDADAETLLKKSRLTMDRIYSNRYLGMKRTISQPLFWPRIFAQGTPHGVNEWPYTIVDSDGNPRDFTQTPPEMGYAQVEMSNLFQTNVDPYAQPDAKTNFVRDVVGSLEHQVRTSDANSHRVDPLYKISLILRPLLNAQVGSIPITRGA
jgi:hypothetical protein